MEAILNLANEPLGSLRACLGYLPRWSEPFRLEHTRLSTETPERANYILWVLFSRTTGFYIDKLEIINIRKKGGFLQNQRHYNNMFWSKISYIIIDISKSINKFHYSQRNVKREVILQEFEGMSIFKLRERRMSTSTWNIKLVIFISYGWVAHRPLGLGSSGYESSLMKDEWFTHLR